MFKVDSTSGTWSLKSGSEELTNCEISINYKNLLIDTEISEIANGFRATKTQDDFKTDVTFTNDKDGWNRIAMSLKNVSEQPSYISKVYWFSHPLYSCFKKSKDIMKFFGENGKCTEIRGKVKCVNSRMVGVLTQDLSANAWVVGFEHPQCWSSSVDVYVDSLATERSVFSAFINHGPAPIRIEPGEEFIFDTMVISCEKPVVEGLQEFGKLCTPRTPATKTKAHSGYNTWEYYRDGITAKACREDLDALAANDKVSENIRYFILDHGWQKSLGDWVFDVDKFGMDVKEWCKCVEDKGMIPGLWVAPFLATEAVIKKLGTVPVSTGWGKSLVLDPSDPVVIDYVCGQLKDLVSAGVKYFKTDFLTNALRLGMRPYKCSNKNGEAVFRNFFARMREAIGEDTFWLACGTDLPSCAGLADAARISGDVKANWKLLKGHLMGKILGRFWMHGNFWINDADFLILKGEHLKQGCPHTLNDNCRVPFEGFTHDEAILWATTLVITGSLITWSDSPRVIDEAGVDIVSRCIDHCGGVSGIPLDFGKKEFPERWVKKDNGKLYVALFNFDDEEKTLSLAVDEEPELGNAAVFKDIFSNEEHSLSNGKLEFRLRPHSAKCLLKIG